MVDVVVTTAGGVEEDYIKVGKVVDRSAGGAGQELLLVRCIGWWVAGAI
jgi:deoxyhypusine synthase